MTNLSQQQIESIKNAKDKFENFSKELNTKVYIVEGRQETFEVLKDFFENEVTWNTHESLGVVKILEDITAASKKKEIFLTAVCIEAIWYFLNKHSGKGYAAAKKFTQQIAPVYTKIHETIQTVMADRKKLENLKEEWAEIEQNIAEENSKEFDEESVVLENEN